MSIGIRCGIPDASRRRGAFVPTQIAGCVTWVRADRGITLNGSNVSAWANQVAGGPNLVQATAAQQPLYIASDAALNGQPALSFDGGDLLSSASLSLPRAMTWFFVLGAITTRGMLIEHGAANTGAYAYAAGAASAAVFGATGIGYHRSRESPPTLWAMPNTQNAIIYNESAAPVLRASRAVVPPTLEEGVAQVAQSISGGFNIGARSDGSLPHTGRFAEFFAYDRALTAAEIARVESYLFARYRV